MKEAATVESPYLTTNEAAEYTGLHPTTLWRARKEGKLKASGYGRSVRYHVRDLDKMMQETGRDQ